MRVIFIDTMNENKLGVEVLSSVLKRSGHEVDCVLVGYEEDWIRVISDEKPNVVAFGSFIGQEPDVIDVFTRVKAIDPRIVTLQGGPSVLIYDQLINHKSVDFVLKGDAEETIVELLDAIENDKDLTAINGLLWKNSGDDVIINDGLPITDVFGDYIVPDHDLFMKYDQLKEKRTKPFIWSRGCPYPCTYCGTATLNDIYRKEQNKKHFRYGDVQEIIKEIKYVKDKYGLEWVHFHDATLNANRKQVERFLLEYSQNDMPPFICNIRSEGITEDLVRLFKKAKCDRVTIGVQSGSESIRTSLSGRRTQSDENILNTVKLFKKYGIRVHIDLILGWPGENIKDAMDTLALAKKIDADKISGDLMIYYPDGEITRYAYTEGYLDKYPDVFDIAKLTDPFYSQLKKTPDINMLINMNHLFSLLLMLGFEGKESVLHYLLNVRPNRFYYFFKDLPYVLTSMKYDAVSISDKIRILVAHTKAVYNIRKIHEMYKDKSEYVKNTFHYETKEPIGYNKKIIRVISMS